NFFQRHAFASGLGCNVEREVNGELIGVCRVVEGSADRLAVERLVGHPVLGFLDDRPLARRFLAITLDGDDVRRVHRAHHIEVLTLSAQFYKLVCNGSKTHDELSFVKSVVAARIYSATPSGPRPRGTTLR